jgi:hypothetical protein
VWRFEPTTGWVSDGAPEETLIARPLYVYETESDFDTLLKNKQRILIVVCENLLYCKYKHTS